MRPWNEIDYNVIPLTLTWNKLGNICTAWSMEPWWNDIDRKVQRTQRRTRPSATLSTKNSTWTDQDVNLGCRDERTETNCLSHGMAKWSFYTLWETRLFSCDLSFTHIFPKLWQHVGITDSLRLMLFSLALVHCKTDTVSKFCLLITDITQVAWGKCTLTSQQFCTRFCVPIF
jgi:hypothetical protein